MESQQEYNSLSDALQPPLSRSPNNHYRYVNPGQTSAQLTPQPQSQPPPPQPGEGSSGGPLLREEEEEEEEDEDMVEGELQYTNTEDKAPSPVSQEPSASSADRQRGRPPMTSTSPLATAGPLEQPVKRRPGRPKGSKTKNRRDAAPAASASVARTGPAYPEFNQLQQATPELVFPASVYPEVTEHNKQYYEFQWRMLTLCSEFYNAAEELVRGASPLVVAQSYQLGPTIPVDPLAMLQEAKRICDHLLANPKELVSRPPPPVFPTLPTWPTPPYGAPPPVPPPPPPQTFVMPVGPVPQHHHPAPAPYPPGPHPGPPPYGARYGPTAYFPPPPPPHPGPPGPPGYGAPPPPPPHYPTPWYSSNPGPSGPPMAGPSAPAPVVTASRSSKEGLWSDEEVERLRALAEESKRAEGSAKNGEPDWDWVAQRWGPGRSRQQLLAKSAAMGLRDSSTRPAKRPRSNEPESSTASPTSAVGHAPPPTGSHPANALAPSTAGPTPAQVAQARGRGGGTLTWPLASTTQPPGEARTSYYRAAVTAQGRPPSTPVQAEAGQSQPGSKPGSTAPSDVAGQNHQHLVNGKATEGS